MIEKLPVSKKLRQLATEELRAAILEGKIAPGTRLVERTLAEEMGISRTPVHDALNRLVVENLVKKLPNNGFAVAQIERKDIIELYTIRLRLEPLAVEWAISHISPSIIRKLKKNIERMEKCLSKSDIGCIKEMNIQFHQILLSAAQSHVLASFIEQAQINSRLFRIRSLSAPNRTTQVIAEHKTIVEALEKADVKAAVESMTEHLTNALNWRLLLLESHSGNGVENEDT
ncbi:MAG: GntR family transcriptional regulator [Synergistaceae bacterium]|jgi:DNA-binding GntR family transcriptional regulator|nr:GntR family transcriptional regulator [Synergistaceae bacterium]